MLQTSLDHAGISTTLALWRAARPATREPLGPDGVRATKEFYGWDPDQKFFVPGEVNEHMRALGERGQAACVKTWCCSPRSLAAGVTIDLSPITIFLPCLTACFTSSSHTKSTGLTDDVAAGGLTGAAEAGLGG